LYGSSRIGHLQENAFASYEVKPKPGDPDIEVIGFSEFSKHLRMAEVNYDSPATQDWVTGAIEQHLGEYIALYNGSELSQNLDELSLTCNGQTLNFNDQVVIHPGQTLLVAFGQPSDKTDFLALTNLEDRLTEAETTGKLEWYWQTHLELPDAGSTLYLEYVSKSDTGILVDFRDYIDIVEFGGSPARYEAVNSYYDVNSPFQVRASVSALQKDPSTLVLPESIASPDMIRLLANAQWVYGYEKDPDELRDSLSLDEHTGEYSNKVALGTPVKTENVYKTANPQWVAAHASERGKKFFELSNHLGNVLATVTDQLKGQADVIEDPDLAVSYLATVNSLNDYYPFGKEMTSRSFVSSSGYRYGFNGKENDPDWGGQLIQDYGFRLYNPGIAKFLSVDPLAPDYPFFTPYQFAGNMPTSATDLDGLEPNPTNDQLEQNFIFNNSAGLNSVQLNQFMQDFQNDLTNVF
ncbi:MAG: RHS repeat-associated core domain-containing protein, partial [Bacteroidota bacterium]